MYNVCLLSVTHTERAAEDYLVPIPSGCGDQTLSQVAQPAPSPEAEHVYETLPI